MKADTRAEDVAVAEDYYDSDDADRFYFQAGHHILGCDWTQLWMSPAFEA